MCMVVDVKTTKTDVIACYIFFLADVIANLFVADVKTTCYSMRRVVNGWCYCHIYLWQML